MWRFRRVREDKFLLQGSQRKSSPPLDVFRLLLAGEFKALELLDDDEAAILAMAAAAAAYMLPLAFPFAEFEALAAGKICWLAPEGPLLTLQLPEKGDMFMPRITEPISLLLWLLLLFCIHNSGDKSRRTPIL